jgi:hypothetical protein
LLNINEQSDYLDHLDHRRSINDDHFGCDYNLDHRSVNHLHRASDSARGESRGVLLSSRCTRGHIEGNAGGLLHDRY